MDLQELFIKFENLGFNQEEVTEALIEYFDTPTP